MTRVKLKNGLILLATSIALGLSVAPSLPVVANPTLTGLAIMETQRRLHRLKDEEELRLMIMISEAGTERRRKLSGHMMTRDDDQHRLLLRFQSPRDIRNTGLLVWENETGDADQWLYLPAFRRVKRIPASGKKNRFMGTDFAYEDLRREAIKLHDYELIGSEILDGQEVFVVEAKPNTPEAANDSGYSKRRSWIDKERYTTLKEEFYDKAGRLWKVQTNKDFVNVQGTVWAPNEIDMHDVQSGTRTIVIIEKRRVDQGLSPSVFTEVELRRSR